MYFVRLSGRFFKQAKEFMLLTVKLSSVRTTVLKLQNDRGLL